MINELKTEKERKREQVRKEKEEKIEDKLSS